MTTTEANHKPRQEGCSVNDLLKGSDFDEDIADRKTTIKANLKTRQEDGSVDDLLKGSDFEEESADRTTTEAIHKPRQEGCSVNDLLKGSDFDEDIAERMPTIKANQKTRQEDGSVDDLLKGSDFEKDNADRKTTTEAYHKNRLGEDSVDDVLKGSDFEHTNRYVKLRKDLIEFYSSMQAFVIKEEFQTHIKKDSYDLDKIEEQLRLRKDDILKTEWPIVIAGETGAGKSTIINVILGEKILPTGITASTSRVCRVKYCEQLMISTRDSKDEELENMSFKNLQEMAQKLKVLAKTNDREISYVDIYMPVPLLQGNVIILDTPGYRDNDVAEKIISNLPNALTVVFVLNVSNARGIQDDMLLQVLSKVKKSMDGISTFKLKDVMFLLNKWDTISHMDVTEQKQFLKETREHLQKLLTDVDEPCIFKTSATKVAGKKPQYTNVFEMFRMSLKSVIRERENERIKVHLRFLNEFLKKCKNILSKKLVRAKQTIENLQGLHELSTELETIEKTTKEEISNAIGRFEKFIDESSLQLHYYIGRGDFRTAVLNDTDKFTRFTIEKELDSRIENMTKSWQKEHIEKIIQDTLIVELIKKFENIHRSLHSIKDRSKGFETPFDVENKVARAFALGVLPNSAGFLESDLKDRILTYFGILTGAAATTGSWMFLSGLVAAGSFENVRELAFRARICVFTEENINCILRKEYLNKIKEVISFLEGDLVNEIIKIQKNITTLKNVHLSCTFEEEILSSLQSTVNKKIKRLQQIGRIDITTE